MAKKDFAAMESRRPSGDSAARAALRSRMAHPTSLRLDEVQPNPLNPRYDDDDQEVRELAETLARVGQLQPTLVVAREQFLQAYPAEQERLGPQPWVVIVGNRRLAAARLAGRPALDVRVAVDLATAEDFEDRILIENIQRKELPPLLEAAHLQRRLNRPGQTIRSVGEAIGKSHTYVQQRLDLLRMIPEFQQLLRDGGINIRTGRQLGALPEEEQRAVLAAGPPFTPEARKKTATTGKQEDSGNQVSNSTAEEQPSWNQASSSRAGEQAGNQVSKTESHETGATTRSAPGNPSENGHRNPAPGPRDLAAAGASVGQWLDSALAELDRALPAGGDGDVGQALADARRHIEQARAALRRATTAGSAS